MQALLSGKLSLYVLLLFPVLLVSAFLLQRLVKSMRDELDMAKYELERGPVEEAPEAPPETERLPGYMMLTEADLKEAYEKVLREMTETGE